MNKSYGHPRSVPTTGGWGKVVKASIPSAKEPVLYFMNDGKLLKTFKDWGIERAIQLGLHLWPDHCQQLKEGSRRRDWTWGQSWACGTAPSSRWWELEPGVREEVERRGQVAECFVYKNNRSDLVIDYRMRTGSESKQGRLTRYLFLYRNNMTRKHWRVKHFWRGSEQEQLESELILAQAMAKQEELRQVCWPILCSLPLWC